MASEPGCAAAAISSAMAAEVHGLEVLRRGIQDVADNATRFFVLRRADTDVSDGPPPLSIRDERGDREGAGRWKSLVKFTVPHERPGALAKALGAFGSKGVNMTSYHTRPTRGQAWRYVHFVEFEGRREEGGRGVVDEVLGELERVTEGCRWHGSWLDRGRRDYGRSASGSREVVEKA